MAAKMVRVLNEVLVRYNLGGQFQGAHARYVTYLTQDDGVTPAGQPVLDEATPADWSDPELLAYLNKATLQMQADNAALSQSAEQTQAENAALKSRVSGLQAEVTSLNALVSTLQAEKEALTTPSATDLSQGADTIKSVA
ncbi:hypothetical protein [Burkholderia sp. PU8-34]